MLHSILSRFLAVSLYFFSRVLCQQTNVAFVFSGSARTFSRRPIYLSIKYNLIDSFCPPPNCNYHIFFRVSITDNTHVSAENTVVTDARGRQIPMTDAKLMATRNALKFFGDKASIDIVEIGSTQEQAGMLNFSHNNVLHKVYSTLDTRRYSMYLNRYYAYQMALKFETEHLFKGHEADNKFDWIVHARLDFFWAAPVRAAHLWSPQRIWFPDNWATDVPDTFAIIPRHLADTFYSLDAMYVRTDVACLGGPNFDPNSVTPEALLVAGFTPPEISIIETELCTSKFPNAAVSSKRNGMKWSWAGISETMLKRKLKLNGIHFDFQNFGYSTFFGFIVRAPFDIRCHEQEPDSFIAWAKKYYQPSYALAFVCYSTSFEFQNFFSSRAFVRSSQRIPLLVTGRYNHKDKRKENVFSCPSKSMKTEVQHMTSVVASDEVPKLPCLLEKEITNWNFMPFRITMMHNIPSVATASDSHSVPKTRYCMTADTINQGSLPQGAQQPQQQQQQIRDIYSELLAQPSVSECINRINLVAAAGRETYLMHYEISQLFHFYPTFTSPQPIFSIDINRKGKRMQRCLTVANKNDSNRSREYESSFSLHSFSLEFHACLPWLKSSYANSNQLFQVIPMTETTTKSNENRFTNSSQLLIHAIIHWSVNVDYCLTFVLRKNQPHVGQQPKFVLAPCKTYMNGPAINRDKDIIYNTVANGFDSSSVLFEQELLLEQTMNTAPSWY